MQSFVSMDLLRTASTYSCAQCAAYNRTMMVAIFSDHVFLPLSSIFVAKDLGDLCHHVCRPRIHSHHGISSVSSHRPAIAFQNPIIYNVDDHTGGLRSESTTQHRSRKASRASAVSPPEGEGSPLETGRQSVAHHRCCCQLPILGIRHRR